MDNLNAFIDHTCLKATASHQDIQKLCEEAIQYNFASVVVHPSFVSFAARELLGSQVAVGTTVGFPLGANEKKIKGFEAKLAIENGATEIDMVMHIGAFKEGSTRYVEDEIWYIREICSHTLLKVIIETCYLSDSEKIEAAQLVKSCGADFVKTSTGFGSKGATVEDVLLLRKVVGFDMGVKASGGIKDRETAVSMIHAGASRIGSSASLHLIGIP